MSSAVLAVRGGAVNDRAVIWSLLGHGVLVLVVLMFIGRVGPLTLVLAVGPRPERGRFRYAEENVMVG